MDDARIIYGTVCQEPLCNNNLTFGDKTVYALLTTFARNKDHCFPSIRMICKMLNASTATVTKSMKSLEREGIITAEKSAGRPTIYYLNITPSVSKIKTSENDGSVSIFVSSVSENETEVFQKLKRGVSKIETEEYKENKQLIIEDNNSIVASDPQAVEKNENSSLPKQPEEKKAPPIPRDPPIKRFVKPSPEQVTQYMLEIDVGKIEAEKFYDYYQGNGWKVGRNPMKDWQATCRNWKRNIKYNGKNQSNQLRPNGTEPGKFTGSNRPEDIFITL